MSTPTTTVTSSEAYAILSGFIGETPFEERIHEIPCTLGRKYSTFKFPLILFICSPSASAPSHVHIGNAEIVSRVHCEINWEETSNSFTLFCKSKNGCLVDGKQVN